MVGLVERMEICRKTSFLPVRPDTPQGISAKVSIFVAPPTQEGDEATMGGRWKGLYLIILFLGARVTITM